ncbi:MAG: T9SS type A sorting domain-containing protein [candidate division WOR-3 bacterium]
MKKKTFWLLLAVGVVGSGIAHNITIERHEVPLVIDTYSRFKQNSSPFNWTPFDSTRQVWDVTAYPGQLRAKTGLRIYTEGRYPAPDTMENDSPPPYICEFDTLGDGSESETYLYLDSFALYADGIDFTQGGFRFIGNYRPDGLLYSLPMYYGASWITAWTWQYEIYPGIIYQAAEQHQKRIIAKGKVKVPMSGDYFWPCLVIQDYMVYSDNMGTLDRRWIYEWVVPGHFSGGNGVCAALSQNGASPDFITVQTFMQVETCSIPGWDLRPPVFANTRVWSDTTYLGPYVVWSTITDNKALGTESLFYRINQGNWIGVPPDSLQGNTYYFTIPEVSGAARIDYYIWAMDSFSLNNNIEFWTTWPVCSPESTMITFNVEPTGSEEKRAILPGEAKLTVLPNPLINRTTFILYHPFANSALMNIYRPDGTLVKSLPLTAETPGKLSATFDARNLSPGIYFYNCQAEGFSQTGKITILR